jgi:hypothetical protein
MGGQILLVDHVAVHCHQNLKAAFDRLPEKIPVLDSSPTK